MDRNKIDFLAAGFIRGFVQKKFSLNNGNKHTNTILCVSSSFFGYGGVEKKFPEPEDENIFAKIFFHLQRYVEEGIFCAPRQGDEPQDLYKFYWETTNPDPMEKVLKYLSE